MDDQEFNYLNETYCEEEYNYKIIRDRDGLLMRVRREHNDDESGEQYDDSEETEDEQYERWQDEQAESKFEDLRSEK